MKDKYSSIYEICIVSILSYLFYSTIRLVESKSKKKKTINTKQQVTVVDIKIRKRSWAAGMWVGTIMNSGKHVSSIGNRISKKIYFCN